jgi:hypothetical protein
MPAMPAPTTNAELLSPLILPCSIVILCCEILNPRPMPNDKFQMPKECQNPNIKPFLNHFHLGFEIWISFEF